jgi:hypothetical protein
VTGIRVTALEYTLDLPESLEYRNEARRNVTLDGFTGELTPKLCKFVATEHFVSVSAAREKLEPQLERWRTWVRLRNASDLLPFRYSTAQAEPWPPSPPGQVGVISGGGIIFGGSGKVAMAYAEFPAPPAAFAIDDCVRVGRKLLDDAAKVPGHELKFAWTFFTLLVNEHGGRKDVSTTLNVAKQTIEDFAELCARGGLGAEARKFSREPRIDFTSDQREWLLHVFRELVTRQGQFAAGAVPFDQYGRPRCWTRSQP